MAFIDEVTLRLKAGKGGDGVVRWRREKYILKGGPYGGNGGKGGDVYFEAVRDIAYLRRYRAETSFTAESGKPGETKVKTGRGGEDLVLKVPIGSRISFKETGQILELMAEGERALVLKGGRGGKGNTAFKSSVNRTPLQFEFGKPGEEGTFLINLALIADIGIIGLPNAGKTTLLNSLTHAAAKVGAYPFTTLEPNLGALGPIILADIPGLIEGASHGKGLGDKFLKHITRTRMLVHCVALNDQNWAYNYDVIRRELGDYDKRLLAKPETIVLTKADLANKDIIADAKRALKATKRSVHVVSSLKKPSIRALAKFLSQQTSS